MEIPKWLREIADETEEETGIKIEFAVKEDPYPNADVKSFHSIFHTLKIKRPIKVHITSGLLEHYSRTFTKDEIKALLLHEIGHVRTFLFNKHGLATMIVGVFSISYTLALWLTLLLRELGAALLGLPIYVLACWFIYKWATAYHQISRELQADMTIPPKYRRAAASQLLKTFMISCKLLEQRKIRVKAVLFPSHPPLHVRLRILGYRFSCKLEE